MRTETCGQVSDETALTIALSLVPAHDLACSPIRLAYSSTTADVD
jgi:hypothetical protein